MASPCLSEDLTCSICLSVYTEPVMLLCGHSFCRDCISASLDKQKHCPICRTGVDTAQALLTNHVLRSLVEKMKQKLEYRQDKEKSEFLCPEHDEKLKLYCITDQQLICVICRDSQSHESHKFKPVSEASAMVRNELQSLLNEVCEDTRQLDTLVQSQKKEVSSTEQRSGELKSLIRTKFKEMHMFLQKKEQELTEQVKSSEEAELNKMNGRLRDIETAIAENRTLHDSVTSALKTQDHELFLKTWSDEKKTKGLKGSFKPKNGNLQVEKTDLSLGPYESHLQMFVWKEMLQIVMPREEQLLLRNDQTSLMVSQDQRCATFCPPQQQQQNYHRKRDLHFERLRILAQYNSPCVTQSTGTYEEQHYWEAYVGQHNSWELGIPNIFLKNNGGTYQICSSSGTNTLAVEGNPQKIGIYLNCPRKELSFYNADTMKHIHTESLASTSLPVSAHFSLGNSRYHDPLMVCRY